MTERLFSTYQIAKLLGATLSSVVAWMDNGALKFCRMPDGTTRITESALINFLTEQGIDLGEEFIKAGSAQAAAANKTEVSGLLPESVADDTPAETPPVMIDDTPDQPDDPTPEYQSETAAPDKTPQPIAAEATHPDLRVEQVCDAILSDAVKLGAQTIHLTPQGEHLVLQLRVNGVLRDKQNFDRCLPTELRRALIEHVVKLAAPDADPAELAVPLNAEFTREIDGQELTMKLSSIPTTHGTRLVIHLSLPPAELGLLGLEEASHARLETMLQSDGLIVVASKRKTGRDTTLQTMLAAAASHGAGAIAIGRHPTGAAVQLQIDPPAGLTYSAAAAAIEHQDADAVILTELRDPATAVHAFDAAHDGALVVAGTNANSAAGAVGELIQMGLEPWPLGATLKAVVEQASVPTLCEHCRRPDDNSSYEPTGCDRCGQTGWSGRTILTGVVFIDAALTEQIRTCASIEQIARAVAQHAPESLANVAKLAAAQGITTADHAAGILR